MDRKMDAKALQEFLIGAFPQVAGDFVVEDVAPPKITVRMPVSDQHLRPGGTVSGPTLFALADVAMYLGILSAIGPEALAVTTNCAIDFMRKPAAGKDLLARAEILKLGRVLAVGAVRIYSDGVEEPVAQANLTYSIPPKRNA